MPSKPHGGRLVNRVASKAKAERILKEIKEFKAIPLSETKAADLENIARGIYSP